MVLKRIAILSCVVFLSTEWAFAQCMGSGVGDRPGPRYRLVGRVMSATGGLEVPSAWVKLEGRGTRRRGFTDSLGHFRFECLEPGLYAVEVGREGYETTREQLDLLSGSLLDATVRMRPTTTIDVQPEGRVLSVRQAQIPKRARKAFDRGVKELHKKERPNRSLEHFQRAIEIHPDYDETYVQLGIALSRLSRPEEAEQIFRKGIEVYPQNTRAYTFLGKLHYQQGKMEEAIEALRNAVEIDDNFWLAHLDLGRILGKQGEVEDAYRHAYRAHQLHTEAPDVHLTLYNACVNKSDYAGALAELDEFVRLYPDSDAAKRMLAIRDGLSQEVAPENRR